MVTHSSILCLKNSMDRGAWQAAVLRVAQSQTRLKQLSTQHTHTPDHFDDHLKLIWNCKSTIFQTIFKWMLLEKFSEKRARLGHVGSGGFSCS